MKTRLAVSPQYIWHIPFREKQHSDRKWKKKTKNTTPQQKKTTTMTVKRQSSATNKVFMTEHKYNQLHFKTG